MTVKCLDTIAKNNIELDFTLGVYDINELSEHYSCSRRTIIRVLEERGIDPGIRRRNNHKKQETSTQIEVVLPTIHDQPAEAWYRRLFKNIRQVFNPTQYGQSTFQ